MTPKIRSKYQKPSFQRIQMYTLKILSLKPKSLADPVFFKFITNQLLLGEIRLKFIKRLRFVPHYAGGIWIRRFHSENEHVFRPHVFEENSVREIIYLNIVTASFSKSSVFKMFALDFGSWNLQIQTGPNLTLIWWNEEKLSRRISKNIATVFFLRIRF